MKYTRKDLGAYKQGQVWRISRKAIPSISDKVDIEHIELII